MIFWKDFLLDDFIGPLLVVPNHGASAEKDVCQEANPEPGTVKDDGMAEQRLWGRILVNPPQSRKRDRSYGLLGWRVLPILVPTGVERMPPRARIREDSAGERLQYEPFPRQFFYAVPAGPP